MPPCIATIQLTISLVHTIIMSLALKSTIYSTSKGTYEFSITWFSEHSVLTQHTLYTYNFPTALLLLI